MSNKLSNSAPAIAAALAKAKEFGAQVKLGIVARYDAAIYFGAQVKEGALTIADADKYVAAYQEGMERKLTAGSLKTVVSNFRSFASDEVIARSKEIKTAVDEFLAKNPSSQDLFAAAYGVNSKINAAKKAGKKPAALATLVKEVCKPKPAGKKDGGKTKEDPAAEYASAKEMVMDAAKILNGYQLTDEQQAAVDALLALKW